MENTSYDSFQQDQQELERPDFLKILCVLSFVCCGLWILFCALGTTALSLDAAAIEQAWEPIPKNYPELAEVEPISFMHDFGIWSVCVLIANVFSLVGVIMMWRLEKIGFFVYVIAELAFYFFRLEVGEKGSVVPTGLFIILDLGFIAMYLANLRYMNRKNNTTFIQSGS